MAKKHRGNIIGAWAFLIGVVLAVLIGLFSSYIGSVSYAAVLGLLVILGIVVGLLNVGSKDSSKFLLAALALVVVSYMGQGTLFIIKEIGYVLNALLVLFIPATIIVALKSLFEISKN